MKAQPHLRGFAPEPGSTAWKVIEFLTTNPDETLTASDIEAKFGKPEKQVHSFLSLAVNVGVLKRSEMLSDGELHYSLGNGHPSIKANAVSAPSLRSQFPPQSPSPKARRYRIRIDVAALPIETDKPVPPPNTGNRTTDWHALFARMKPGHSVQLPKGTRSTLMKAISAHHKAREGSQLVLRTVDEENIRLWMVK